MDNIYILREIAKHDKNIWKLFSLLNKELNTYFNVHGLEYELCFRIIEFARGRVEYKLDGYFHRTDGPALSYNNGTEESWYIRGNCIDQMDPQSNVVTAVNFGMNMD